MKDTAPNRDDRSFYIQYDGSVIKNLRNPQTKRFGYTCRVPRKMAFAIMLAYRNQPTPAPWWQ